MKVSVVALAALVAAAEAAPGFGWPQHGPQHGPQRGGWGPWSKGWSFPWGKKPSKKPIYGLNALATAAGKLYFGTALDDPSVWTPYNPQYQDIAYNTSEFGQVTPANGQKWMYIEPEQNVFNFTMGDAIIQPALQRGALTRCHNLVWHSQLPEWLTEPATPWTRDQLIAILENHIKNEVTHYKGQCYAWDVVNEALFDNGTYRADLWLDTIGPEYIPMAFKFAEKYDSKVKLYYNDYNIENINNKSTAVRDIIIPAIRNYGARIDGVGLQAHFVGNSTPSYDDQVENMEAFAALGVEVAQTELDVRIYLPETVEKVAQQAEAYANSTKACLDVKACVGTTVWDFYDPVSWVPSTFPGQGNADLFWANFTRKPAYYAIADVFRAAIDA